MKKIFTLLVLFLLSSHVVNAQKFQSILDKSSLSFNYGISYDYFAKKAGGGPARVIDFGDVDEWGQIFGFEYSYRLKGKNEIGFGFSRQSHRREYNEELQTSFALITLNQIVFKDTKNFHHLFLKRHFMENRLMGSFGLYTIKFSDTALGIRANSDQTEIDLRECCKQVDFGVFVGIEYYHDIRNFQVGVRSRLFYTMGYESPEAFEFTPVIKFKL
jgi:hypothetical protein